MPASIHIRNRRGELVEALQVSASDAKNGFGRVLDRVAREGGVAITKHDEPCAVLVSVEVFRTLAGGETRTLNTLSGEFDALLERMQAPGAAAAMQKAYDMAPEQLGRAAVKQAALAAQRRGDATKVSTATPRAPAVARGQGAVNLLVAVKGSSRAPSKVRGKKATALAAAKAPAPRIRRTFKGAVAASAKGDHVVVKSGVRKNARRARG